MKASNLFAFSNGRDSLQYAVGTNLLTCARSVLNAGEADKDAVRDTCAYFGIKRIADTVYMPLGIADLRTRDALPMYATLLFKPPYRVPCSMLQGVQKNKHTRTKRKKQ